MQTVPRYYVEMPKYAERDIVIRDRISPHANSTYPCDIAVTIPIYMYPNKNIAKSVAEYFCRALNEWEAL